jgi:ABC-type transport system involved in cytochrome c biogenesis permease subunit
VTEAQLAELSRTLYAPVTLALFTVSMLLYLYAMAFGHVDREDLGEAAKGRRARALGTVVAVAGVGTLIAHIVTRIMASGRLPLGNMFEFSTIIALTVVLAGLVVFQWRLRRPELMGFLLLGAVLTMAGAMLVYTEPGPLMPILGSWWRGIHVSAIVFAAGIFTVGFVFTGLYLLRDTAERRLAARGADGFTGSTVGAAYAGDVAETDDPDVADVVPERAPVETDLPAALIGPDHRTALRTTINPWALAGGTWVATATLSWVFWVDAGDPRRFLMVNTVMALAAVIAWFFVPYLPDAATLDSFTYRTIAFGFPIWTFAVISGAIWAEQSWGRYWGWDPKETSAFLTWVAYAGYLHARATRGMRGRNAAYLGLGAFAVLMFTYFVVNLVVVGLHSYA